MAFFGKYKLLKVAGILLLAALFYLVCFHLLYVSPKLESRLFTLCHADKVHTNEIWTVKFSPDGHLLASAGVDSIAIIRNMANKKPVKKLQQNSGITNIAFSNDSRHLATSGYDGLIRIWDIGNAQIIKMLKGSLSTTWSVDISSDNKFIAAGSQDGNLLIWDFSTGVLLKNIHAHELTVWNVKFSPDNRQIATGSFDETVKITDVSTGKIIKVLTGHNQAVVALDYCPDGKFLATTGDDCKILLWNAKNWTLHKSIDVPEHIQGVDFSPESTMFITSGRDKPATGEFIQNFLGDSKMNKGVSMRLFEATTGKLLQTFSEHENDVNEVAFSPDGKYIASAGSDHFVRVWKSN